MMARSPSSSKSKAGYIDARPLTANSTNSLATHGRTIHWVMCGWPPAGKGFFRMVDRWSCGHVWMAPSWQGIFSHGGSVVLRSCVRPVDAAEAAGPDGNRGSRPDQTH